MSPMPVVFVNGPRQAGKSTLVQHLVQAGLKADYVTFDDVTAFSAASNDAEGFLRRSQTPLVIDEVQLVPGVFRVLKILVDEYRARGGGDANGRFLLTGSANVLALPGLADALVGRMAVLSLYPLAACEMLGQGQPVVNGLFDQDLPTAQKDEKAASLADAVYRATFPEISGAERRAALLWFDGYLTTLLQRDVRQLADIENIPALPNILRLLAARASGLLNDADCARDAKLNPMTYRRYRSLLTQLFLLNLVPPWHRNIGKRLIKSPKLYFIDTALLCHQLGVDLETLEKRDPGLFGRVLENFVASELTKQIGMIPDTALHHFRTQEGHEVDFVLERRNGTILGIEVKSSSSVSREDFAGLEILKRHAGRDFIRGIVLYRGEGIRFFAEDMVALPLEYLWKLNMDVSTDRDIQKSQRLNDGYFFWADYGDRTRVCCLIARETVDDYFFNHASEREAIAAIKHHWDVIWPIFKEKIANGHIEMIHHDLGPNMISGRHQTIKQVILNPADFGYRDFRKP